GFLFPNTKYAKLNTGIPLQSYMAQGAYYLWDFASYDVFSFLFIAAALGYACLRVLRKHAVPDLAALNAFSILLYLGYVMVVGGDFMAGRFLALPFFACLLLLAQLGGAWSAQSLQRLAMVMAAGLLAQWVQYEPRDKEAILAHHGIADERNYYLDANTLFPEDQGLRREPGGGLRKRADKVKEDAQAGVVEYDYTGVYGFYVGPNFVVIDRNALSDPLLARLPIPNVKQWRIGHFTRGVPRGYLHARRTGDTSQMREGLKEYYEALRLVTSAPLWDSARLRAILAFQRDAYEEDRQRFFRAALAARQKRAEPEEDVETYE
ncbi:MAG: hypothetical protein K2Q01_08740, partial [Rickettsiales bacterium]|nr:hypothetical protein [Rickettsiales bacterium]